MTNVKGLILKTVLITLSAIVILAAATYLVFYLAFPKSLAKVYDDMGSSKISVSLMERAYEKTGDTDDLIKLCNYAIKTGDNGVIAKHLEKLFIDSTFYDYSKNVDDGEGLYNFYAGKYLVARFCTEGDKAAVIDKAFAITKNYTAGNGVQAVIVEILDGKPLDSQSLSYLYSQLTSKVGTFAPEEEVILQVDIANVRQILNG